MANWEEGDEVAPPGLNPYLPLVRRLEGSGDSATSPAGAVGRYQIMPDTARRYGFDPARLSDPNYSAMVASTILDDNLKRTGGRLDDALVLYNGSPKQYQKWVQAGRDPNALTTETRNYLQRAAVITGKPMGAPAWEEGTPAQGQPAAWEEGTEAKPQAPQPTGWEAVAQQFKDFGQQFLASGATETAGAARGTAGQMETEANEAAKAGGMALNLPGSPFVQLSPREAAQAQTEVAQSPHPTQAAVAAAVSPLEEWGEQNAVQNPGIGAKIGGFAGGMAPLIAGGLAGPAGAITAFQGSSYDQGEQDALRHGADAETAETVGLANAGIGGVLGAVPVGEGAAAVAERAGLEGVPAFLAERAISAPAMGGVMAAQTAGGNVVAQQTYDPNRPWTEQVGSAFIGGALGDVAFGGAHALGGAVAGKARTALGAGWDWARGAMRPAERPEGVTIQPDQLPEADAIQRYAGVEPQGPTAPGAPGAEAQTPEQWLADAEQFVQAKAAGMQEGDPVLVETPQGLVKGDVESVEHPDGGPPTVKVNAGGRQMQAPVDKTVPLPKDYEAEREAHGAPLEQMPQAIADVAAWRQSPKGYSLFNAIKDLGGIKTRDANGELNDVGAILKDAKFPPGMVNNKTGLDPDTMRETLQGRDWFGVIDRSQLNDEVGPQPGDDPDHLLELLKQERAGQKVYHPTTQTEQALAQRQAIDEQMASAGVSVNDPPAEAAAKLAAWRAQWLQDSGQDMQALKARAQTLGVPVREGAHYDELLGDVLEREAILAESGHLPDEGYEDLIEHAVERQLTPEQRLEHAVLTADEHEWLSHPDRGPRGVEGEDQRADDDGADAGAQAAGQGEAAEPHPGAEGGGADQGGAAEGEPGLTVPTGLEPQPPLGTPDYWRWQWARTALREDRRAQRLEIKAQRAKNAREKKQLDAEAQETRRQADNARQHAARPLDRLKPHYPIFGGAKESIAEKNRHGFADDAEPHGQMFTDADRLPDEGGAPDPLSEQHLWSLHDRWMAKQDEVRPIGEAMLEGVPGAKGRYMKEAGEAQQLEWEIAAIREARKARGLEPYPVDQRRPTHEKPLAGPGLTSYRYRGPYGWVMIGAKDHAAALNEANRSLERPNAELGNLEIWHQDSHTYRPVEGGNAPEPPPTSKGGLWGSPEDEARVLAAAARRGQRQAEAIRRTWEKYPDVAKGGYRNAPSEWKNAEARKFYQAEKQRLIDEDWTPPEEGGPSETQKLGSGETVEQNLLPGTEQSARQAAAAREGALKPKARQSDDLGDLFDTGRREEQDLFAEPAPKEIAPTPEAKEAQARAEAPKPGEGYGDKNKLVSRDQYEEAKRKLRDKLRNQLNAGLDPEMIYLGTQMAAFHLEAGARKLGDFIRAMVDDLGEGAVPYLKMWYEGARHYPGNDYAGDMTGSGHVTDETIERIASDVLRSRPDLEPDRAAAAAGDGNGPGAVPAAGGAADAGAGGAGAGDAEAGNRPVGGGGLQLGGPAAVGEPGAAGLQSGQPGAGARAAGRGQSVGGGAPRDEGIQPDRTPATQLDAAAGDAAHLEPVAQSAQPDSLAPDAPPVSHDLEAALPTLYPAQRGDVAFAEARFDRADSGPDKAHPGVLFTNGTGTGKTYTGLGVIKRFVDRGDKDILIVAPSQGILNQWVRDGKNVGVDVNILEDTGSPGRKGQVTATTYANLGQNLTLADRAWKLVVADEAHKLTENQNGDETLALAALRAITNHPLRRWKKAEMQMRDEVARVDAMGPQTKNDRPTPAYLAARDALNAKLRERAESFADEPRAKATFLSATPFPYDKSVDWGNGYLFDYGPEPQGRGYNQPDAQGAFFMRHFGYRMRYGKLTKPEAAVQSEVMERQFHEWLRREGALSGRMLDIDHDYDRRFVLVPSAVGQKIDNALAFLREADEGKFRELGAAIMQRFDHLARARLLEAIKAKEAIPIMRQHLKLGRKLVVFHQYNDGGGFSPFAWDPQFATRFSEPLKAVQLHREFMERNPEAASIDDDLKHLPSPIAQLTTAFPQAMLYNGRVPKGQREKVKAAFNTDGNGKDIIIVQADAGEAGISLHDTTGKHQRVLMNLGLPVKPSTAIQQEGRIYRDGNQSDALFRYLNTGTAWERTAFASRMAERSGTAENLAMGERARAMREAFINAYLDSGQFPPAKGEGKGGKAADRALQKSTTDWDKAKSFYFAEAKQRGRRDQRAGLDYFPTPEPLGLKMTQWADPRPGNDMLEPSAGHGAIARWFPESTTRDLVEPSVELASRAGLSSPGANVINDRFENLYIGNKYDSVVMNPPFGHGGSTAIDHLAKAVAHLKDGGRVVALIPTGGAADGRFEKFYDSDAAKGVYMVANIQLPDVTFERAGTKVRARVVVMEKQIDARKADRIQQRDIDLSGVESTKELFDKLENLNLQERQPGVLEEEGMPAPKNATPAAVERLQAAAMAAPQHGGFVTTDTVHGKTGEDLFVAAAKNRVTKEEYGALLAAAKRHGGWYSSFRGGKAVPGFQFKSADARAKFIAETQGVSEPQFARAVRGPNQADLFGNLPEPERPAAVAEALIPNRLGMTPKEASARIPELQAAAEKVATGQMTPAEYRQLVDRYKPVLPYDHVPELAAPEAIKAAVSSNKTDKVGAISEYPEGHPVSIRLDIPAYTNHGVWVPTVHDARNKKTVAYEPAVHIDAASFAMSPNESLRIAKGGAKAPFAAIAGRLRRTDPEEIAQRARMALRDPAWRQVGMDPERHGYFYDRVTQEPIVSAKEVLQVGPLVLAREPTYGETGDVKYARVWHGSPHDFDRFDIGRIGTGEGAQAYGHGLYFAEAKDVAEHYRRMLGGWGDVKLSTHERNGVREMTLDAGAPGLIARDAMAALRPEWPEDRKATGGLGPYEVEKTIGDVLHLMNQYGHSAESAAMHLAEEVPTPHGFSQELRDKVLHWIEFKSGLKMDKSRQGRLYETEIPAPHEFLNRDRLLTSQSPQVLAKLAPLLESWNLAKRFGYSLTDVMAMAPERIAGLKARLQPEEVAALRDVPSMKGGQFYDELAHALVEGREDAASDNPRGWGYADPTRRADPAAASRLLYEAGVPGLRYQDAMTRGAVDGVAAGGTHNYVVFHHDDAAITAKFQRAPVFYSAVERHVQASPMKAAPAEQWKATLANAPGVKKEELEWSGLNDWLDMFPKGEKVPKDKIEAFLRDNGVQLQEVDMRDHGGFDEQEHAEQIMDRAEQLAERNGGDYNDYLDQATDEVRENWTERNPEASFSDWKLPGGDDYHELLLTLPKEANPPDTHFDVKGVLAHVRFDTREDADGRKVLFVEEVQSDWHQKGRDQGYMGEAGKAQLAEASAQADAASAHMKHVEAILRSEYLAWIERRIPELNVEYDRLHAGSAMGIGDPGVIRAGREADMLTRERDQLLRARDPYQSARTIERSRIWDEARQVPEALRDRFDEAKAANLKATEAHLHWNALSHGVPEAPFKTSWPALVMKRVIRWAAENGFDRVAWTTGDQQNERYSLERHIDRLTLQDNSSHGIGDADLSGEFTGGTLMGYDPNGRQVLNQPIHGGWTEDGRRDPVAARKDLESLVGKEAADKLLAQEPYRVRASGIGFRQRHIEGLDLRQGGDGMRAFYDRNLKNIVNDLIKKHGGKVDTGHISQFRSKESAQRALQALEQLRAESSRPAAEIQAEAEAYMREHPNATAYMADDGRPDVDDPSRTLQYDPHLGELQAELIRAERLERAEQNTADMLPPTHGFDITDKLREAALGGFPLFERQPIHADERAPSEPFRTPPSLQLFRALDPDAKAQALIDEVEALVRKLAPFAEVHAMDMMRDPGGRYTISGAAWRDGLRHILAWSLEDGRGALGVARHEAVHVLRKAGLFRPEEWEALARQAQQEDWIGRYNIDAAYGHLPYDARLEEAIAEHLRHGRDDPESFAGKAMQKLRDLLAQVRDMARRLLNKAPDAADVLSRIHSGEVGRRMGEEAWANEDVAEPAFARAPRPAPGTAREEERRPGNVIDRILGKGVQDVGRRVEAAAARWTPDPVADALDDLRMKTTPMGLGTVKAQAEAKDFANTVRAVDFEHGRVDQWLTANFPLEVRKRMWDAADEHGVLLRRGVEPGPGQGLNRLNEQERETVERLQRQADRAFAMAKAHGMTNAEGLESYVPRMVVKMGRLGGRLVTPGEGRRASKEGRNLSTTTGQLKQRKYETVEETEAAAKEHFGDSAMVVHDIRTLNLATQRLERAVAGKILVDKIKDAAKRAGAEPVVEGGGNPDPQAYFTMEHPALQKWGIREFVTDPETGKTRPKLDENGDPIFERQPIWIPKEYEGPLRAVLTAPTGGFMRALLNLKAKMISVIMFNPMIHNAVIWGKAIPADPRGVLTFQAYRDGYAAKTDPATMGEALAAGLDPIGHRFFQQDVATMANEPSVTPGRSWTAQLLGLVPGLFNREAGDAVRAFVDRAGDVWHNTFLWDRVADLQMGLYVKIRDQLLRQSNELGIGEKDAQRIAAHFANRYAGALPMESMSKLARNMANIVMFSRSFTLGNLAAYKDVVAGLPSDVRAQVERDGGLQRLDAVQGIARRKAAGMLIMDMALSGIGLSLAALMTAWLTGQKWQLPWDNEPGRKNRFLIGYQKDGTAIYGRLPTGKVGEELYDWSTDPTGLASRKLSPYARFAVEVATNKDSFDRYLVDPTDHRVGIAFAKRVAAAFGDTMGPQALLPSTQLQALRELATGSNDPQAAALRAFLPLVGITVSRGAPGGPAVGDFYQAKQAHDFAVQQALPGIRDQIRQGDIVGARAKMTQLGIPNGLQNFYVRTARNPATRLSPRAMRDFAAYATPEQKAQFARDRQAAAARATEEADQ